jgi:hypothetical protein
VISRADQPRLHYDAEIGVIIDTPISLSSNQVQRIAAWAVKMQKGRLSDQIDGPRKDELLRIVGILERASKGETNLIHQRLKSNVGADLIPFQASRPQEDRKIISIGKAN